MTVQEILRSTRFWFLGGFLFLGACLFLSLWEPSDRAEQSLCFFRQVTGFPCPGCGLTRGFAALFKLNLSAAIQKHLLSPVFAMEGFLMWIWWGLIAAGKTPMPSSVVVNRLLALQAALLLIVWACRLSGGILAP